MRGGVFADKLKTDSFDYSKVGDPRMTERIVPKRESRYEEIRENRIDRNPRHNEIRQPLDRALDVTLGGNLSTDIQHGLDAAMQINEAVRIRNERVNGE